MEVIHSILVQFGELKDVTKQYGNLQALNHRFDMRNKWVDLAKRYNHCDRIDTAKQLRIIDKSLVVYRRYIMRRILNHWLQLYRWHHFMNYLRRTQRRGIVMQKCQAYRKRVRDSYQQKWKKLANSLLVRNRNTLLIKDFDALHKARRKRKCFEKWAKEFKSRRATKAWERFVERLLAAKKAERIAVAQEKHECFVAKKDLMRRMFLWWRHEMYLKTLDCPLMCKAVLRLALTGYADTLQRQAATKIQKVFRGFRVRKRLSTLLRYFIIWKTRFQIWDSFGVRGKRLERGYRIPELPIDWFDLSKFVGNKDAAGLGYVRAVLDGKRQLAEQQAVMEVSRSLFGDGADTSQFLFVDDGEALEPIERQRVLDRSKVKLLQFSYWLYHVFRYSPVTLVELEVDGDMEEIELQNVPVEMPLLNLENFTSTNLGDISERYMEGLFDEDSVAGALADGEILESLIPQSIAAETFVSRWTQGALLPLLFRCPYIRPRDIFESELPFQLMWAIALLPVGSATKINLGYWSKEQINRGMMVSGPVSTDDLSDGYWSLQYSKPLNVFTASLKRDQLQKSGKKCQHEITGVGEFHPQDFEQGIKIGLFRKEVPDTLRGYSSLCEILLDPLPVNMKLLIRSKSCDPMPIMLESYECNNLGALEQMSGVSPVCYYPIGRVPRSTQFPPSDVTQQELNCYDCVRQIGCIGGFQLVGKVTRRLEDAQEVKYHIEFVAFPCDPCSLRFQKERGYRDTRSDASDCNIGVLPPPFDAGHTPVDLLCGFGEYLNTKDEKHAEAANEHFINDSFEDCGFLGLEFDFTPDFLLSVPLNLLGLFERKIMGVPMHKQTESQLIDLALAHYRPDIGFYIRINAEGKLVGSLAPVPETDDGYCPLPPVLPYSELRDAMKCLDKVELVSMSELERSRQASAKQSMDEFTDTRDVIQIPDFDDLPLEFHMPFLRNMFYLFIPFAPTDKNIKYLLEDYLLNAILDDLPLIYDPIDDELCQEIAFGETGGINPGSCLLPETKDALVPLNRLKTIDVRLFVTKEHINMALEACLSMVIGSLPIEPNIVTARDIDEIMNFDQLEDYSIADTEEAVDVLRKYEPKDVAMLVPRELIDNLIIQFFPELPIESNTVTPEAVQDVMEGLQDIVSLSEFAGCELRPLDEFILVDHVEEVDERDVLQMAWREIIHLPIVPNCITDEPDEIVNALYDMLTPDLISQDNPATHLRQLVPKSPVGLLRMDILNALFEIAMDEAIDTMPIEENDFDTYVALEAFADTDLFPYDFVDSMKNVADPIHAYELKDPAAIVTPGLIGAIVYAIFPDLPIVPNIADDDDIEDIVSILQLGRNSRALVRLEARVDIEPIRKYKPKDVRGYIKGTEIDRSVLSSIMQIELPLVPNTVSDEPEEIVASIDMFQAIESLVPKPRQPLLDFSQRDPMAIADWHKVILICDFVFCNAIDAIPIQKNECTPETCVEIAAGLDDFWSLKPFDEIDIDPLANYVQAPIPVTNDLGARIVNGIVFAEGEESLLGEDRLFSVDEFSRVDISEIRKLRWDGLPILVKDAFIQDKIDSFLFQIVERLPICLNDFDERLPHDVVSSILSAECVGMNIDVGALAYFTDLDYCLPYDRGIFEHTNASVILDVIDQLPIVPNDVDASLPMDILMGLDVGNVKGITPRRDTRALKQMTAIDMPIPVNDDFFKWFFEVILRNHVLPYIPIEQKDYVSSESDEPESPSEAVVRPHQSNLLDGIMDDLVDDFPSQGSDIEI